MDKILEQSLLFDYYAPLLTARQRSVFEMVVQNDLSLSEAAKELSISRQGVRSIVMTTMAALYGYEKQLHLVEWHTTQKEAFLKIDILLKELLLRGDIQTEVKDTLRLIAGYVSSGLLAGGRNSEGQNGV